MWRNCTPAFALARSITFLFMFVDRFRIIPCRAIFEGAGKNPRWEILTGEVVKANSAFQQLRKRHTSETITSKRNAEKVLWPGGGQTQFSFYDSQRKTIILRVTSPNSDFSNSTQKSLFSTGWIKVDWDSTHENNFASSPRDKPVPNRNRIYDHDDLIQMKTISPRPSPVERLIIQDRIVYIKRDDCLHLPSSNISGNKARKFLSLNNLSHLEFPDVIVSYGGPQSNAMVALAAIVSSKNVDLKKYMSRNLDGKQQKEQERKQDENDLFWELNAPGEEMAVRTEEEATKMLQLNDEAINAFDDHNTYDQLQKTKSEDSLLLSSEMISSPPKKRFVYYTKKLPRYLRKYPNGNFLRALTLGMEIVTLSHTEYRKLFGGLHGGNELAPADLDPILPGKSMWMPQGGACGVAEQGCNVLAKEIIDFWSVNGHGMPLAVCIPGGTCTTALYLHRSLKHHIRQRKAQRKGALDIRVVVIPCVGDDEYAMRQMIALDKSAGGTGKNEDIPWILRPKDCADPGSARQHSKGYFMFGEPERAILRTHDKMNKNGLFLDLLYGAPSWNLLLQHWEASDSGCPIAGRQVMYVHSGGLEGISSQLTRYKHKGLLDARSIQPS